MNNIYCENCDGRGDTNIGENVCLVCNGSGLKLNKILQGDCLVEVPKIEDNSINLIVVDPPYGDGVGYGRLDKKIANNEDESINYKILPILYKKLTEGGGLLLIY